MSRSLPQFLLASWIAAAPLVRGAEAFHTNALSILKLSAAQANENRPALLKGVVTCYVPSSQLCFIQDATAGIYIFPSPWPKSLEPGMVVEVEGVTGAGRFSSIVQWARITPTAQTARITPKRIAIEELNTGSFDSQYVELEAVVQSMIQGGDVVNLEVVTGGSVASVLLFDKGRATTNWIDARVRLRGVAGTYYNGQTLSGFGLFVHDDHGLEVVEPAPEPFTQPLRPTEQLAWYSPDRPLDHRIRVRGIVTLSWPGHSFFIQDQSSAIRVVTAEAGPNPEPGTIVEVAGFLREIAQPDRYLAGAVWKRVDSGKVPPAQAASLGDLKLRPPQGRYAVVEGKVIGLGTNGAISEMVLEQSGQIMRAFSRTALSKELNGAQVKISGAWSTPPAGLPAESGPGLWLNGPDSIVIQHPARVQQSQVAVRNPVWPTAAGLAGVLAGGLIAWGARNSTRRARQESESIASRLNALDQELFQLKEGRERLGRDLHDHIIQSIYAVGLKIEDCRQSLDEPGKADPRLRAVLDEINGVIRELRNVIHGLETNTIQPREFRTVLKSLGLTMGDEKSHRLRLEVQQAAVDLLSPTQATELVHIAREAMSNSVRHGKAQTMTFRLETAADAVRFSAEDDGCGFDVECESEKGYGLRNMAKRAKGLGAQFTIESQPGAGVRITLDIPKQNQHFSGGEPNSRINR